jgi:hypothetical protein
MSVDTQQTTWRYIPEDGTLHNHCCENLKSYKEKNNLKFGSERERVTRHNVMAKGQG